MGKFKLSTFFYARVALIFCCIFPSLVHSINSHLYAKDYRDPSRLHFSGGDIIACRIDSNIWSQIYGAEHVMLALSSSDVAHIVGRSKTDTNGHLRQNNFISLTNQDKFTSCRVATDQYDRVMRALGVSPKSSLSAVWDARRDIGRRAYYHLYGCNCQHWVTNWRYGKAWSVQSNQPPSSRCELRNYFMNGAKANANAYSGNGQHGAQASAGVGEYMSGNGVSNVKLAGPNAGAHAEYGSEYTGAGFKAGLGEVRHNFGNAIGASLGASLDTNIGGGSDGFAAQALGTGIVHSKSKGSKVCVFGSCLHFGK